LGAGVRPGVRGTQGSRDRAGRRQRGPAQAGLASVGEGPGRWRGTGRCSGRAGWAGTPLTKTSGADEGDVGMGWAQPGTPDPRDASRRRDDLSHSARNRCGARNRWLWIHEADRLPGKLPRPVSGAGSRAARRRPGRQAWRPWSSGHRGGGLVPASGRRVSGKADLRLSTRSPSRYQEKPGRRPSAGPGKWQ